MCGIVGYTGKRPAQSIILNSLARLEYRGYDSCGIALVNPDIQVFKDAVRVATLASQLPEMKHTSGIGHTRWATHGAPCQKNAHPHTDCTGKIAVVHNGVINNYRELRDQLIKEGHDFISETDTEVIAHLIEKYYQPDSKSEPGINLEKALKEAIKQIDGSYAIIAAANNSPELVFARKDSPLVLGVGDGENLLASDTPAILEYTNRIIYLEDGDVGVLRPDGIKINQNGSEIKRTEQKVLWTADQAKKGGYEHFMLKEIHEQPRIIRDSLSEYLTEMPMPFDSPSTNGHARSILMLACGTSFHACLVGKYVGERLMDWPVRIEMASEYNYYHKPLFAPITIGVTQSGETADTLKAMRKAKEVESKVVAITNVVGSTASKVADYTLFTRAGPEISVAATKSFTAQLIAIYWLGLAYSNLDSRTRNYMILSMRQLPDKIQQVLMAEDEVAGVANKLAAYENIFYIGRGINYPIAMEGALKLKEISYIHSEAYAAGEIKHGPFALLNSKTPVVAIVAGDKTHDAMLTSMREIKSRGSPIFAIAEDEDNSVTDLADYLIKVPSAGEMLSPFVNTVVVQLLSYFTAKKLRCPIDFPRNLAKSVTVE